VTRTTIVFQPLLDPWLIAVLALAGAGLVVLLWWNGGRRAPALVRLLALGILVLALLDPRLEREKRQPLTDIAVLVLDRSLSQTVDGRMERVRRAEKELRAMLGGLENTEVRQVVLQPRDGRDGTALIGALREALADVPPERFAGALLVTDGRVHDMPKNPKDALPPGYSGPVHVLIDGRRDERDRRVVVDRAARYGIVGKPQTIRFHIEQSGGGKGGRIGVTIRVDGERWGVLNVTPGKPVEMEMPVGHAGQNIIEIIADPMAGGELSLRNNHAVVVTKGVRDRLRVLLISGEPHPGERTWRNLLKADPSVDLVHFTILRPPEKQDGTPIRELALIAFPTRELFVEKLDSFDLIIFDRYQRRAILPAVYMANVARYVRNGGAVLLTAGPEYAGVYSLYNTGLSDVVPARPAGGVVRRPFRPAVPEKVLARKGEGRIATLLSDHIWLWARKYDGGGPYVELMRRLAHWLMKEPDLEEEALEGVATAAGLSVTRRTMADAPPPVKVTGPDGKEAVLPMRQVEPGVWRGLVKDAPPGLYRLKSGTLERLAAMGDIDSLEMRALTATGDILKPLTTLTGGAVRWIANGEGVSLPRLVKVPADRAMAGGGWLGLKEAGATRLMAVERQALFATLPMLALALMLLGLAWWAERR